MWYFDLIYKLSIYNNIYITPVTSLPVTIFIPRVVILKHVSCLSIYIKVSYTMNK